MIRVVSHSSGSAAKRYFSDGLSREDYYSESQEVIGRWHGKAAAMLGLGEKVTQQTFERLCDNRHPVTGEQLTPRNDKNRLVGFDINFHAPKSLSVVQAMAGDVRLTAAFSEAVRGTMADIEAQTETRVRVNGVYDDRQTGNLAWAEFTHYTSRPVDDEPDPHLHIHGFAFNATFDTIENRWKAAKIREARRNMPLHQAAFHARLAKKVTELGYAVKRTRNNWEIIGVSPEVIDRFSRRTKVVEAEAERRGLTDDKDKDGLGALTRERKNNDLTNSDLKRIWEKRLSAEELTQIKSLSGSKTGILVTPKQALDHAIEKQFARDSVVRKNRLIAEALRYGVGSVTPQQILDETANRRLIEKRIDGQILCTNYDVLTEEISLIAAVRDGKSRCLPLGAPGYQIKREFLSKEQKYAVREVLTSQDRIIALRGGAGTGKTTTLEEIVEAIKLNGRNVQALAPSASASRDTLRASGFPDANTVAHYLQNEKLQQQTRGHVILVDEAGLLGNRDLWKLFEAAGPHTRILLVGDHRQHASVSRGDPFRVLQQYAGLKTVEITEIRRQKPEHYKAAVAALAGGDVEKGFSYLNKIGAIREIEDKAQRHQKLAEDYVALSTKKSTPLVVSPTRREGREVTNAIRKHLTSTGKLGKESRSFTRYENLHFSAAELKQAENYTPGMLIQFHQNGNGVVRGSRYTVESVSEEGKIILNDKNPLNLSDANKFQAFTPRQIELAQGDLIRITRNGKALDGRRHNNGMVREVAGFTQQGDIKLATGAVIAKDDGHFTYGYTQTSHSSQSKSVRDVLIAQSSEPSPAANIEQFYVSVSRGRERIHIYTENRQELLENVSKSSARMSGLELAGLSRNEIEEIMQKELNSGGWRKALEQRRAKAEMGKQVEKVLETRKRTGLHKSREMTWEQYIQNRRGLGDPAQRLRARSGPNLGKSKVKSTKRGHSLLKTKQLRNEPAKAAKKPPLTPEYKKPQAAAKPEKKTREQHLQSLKKTTGKAAAKPRRFSAQAVRKAKSTAAYQSKAVKGHKSRVKQANKNTPVKKPNPVKTRKPIIKKK
ncbi:MAG: MobF family relaxase [Verrucomicrobiales bacterium]|nr:MobF family relaxase [Verrucomicrobiales bacterium]